MAFNVGDVVQLKSGGPRMTVYQVGPSPMRDDRGTRIWTVWFGDDGKEHTGDYVPETLTLG